MPRRHAKVTQADLARAIRAVLQAGARGTIVVGPDGTIKITPEDGNQIQSCTAPDGTTVFYTPYHGEQVPVAKRKKVIL